MKIIGHRGAAGLALENTIDSIKAGGRAGADMIEIDVHMTRDKKLVLSHDPNLKRSYGVDLVIGHHTLRELRIPCPHLPTLDEALECIKGGVIIELKEFIQPERLFKVTKKYPNLDIRFASFNHHAIRAIKKFSPDAYCYVLEHHSPFEIINKAGKMKADGIGLNYGVINPLTYFLAKQKQLDMYIYTVNKPWIARIMSVLYPRADICSDIPHLFKHLRKKKVR